jgi:hypothetical protein
MDLMQLLRWCSNCFWPSNKKWMAEIKFCVKLSKFEPLGHSRTAEITYNMKQLQQAICIQYPYPMLFHYIETSYIRFQNTAIKDERWDKIVNLHQMSDCQCKTRHLQSSLCFIQTSSKHFDSRNLKCKI